LDASSADKALSLLDVLRNELGKTILMVIHDRVAANRAQVIVRLEKGILLHEGAAERRELGWAQRGRKNQAKHRNSSEFSRNCRSRCA